MDLFPIWTPAQCVQYAQWLCTVTSPSAHWTVTRSDGGLREKGRTFIAVIMDAPWDMRMSILPESMPSGSFPPNGHSGRHAPDRVLSGRKTRACDYNLYSPVPNNLHSHHTDCEPIVFHSIHWRIKENGSGKAPSESCHHRPHRPREVDSRGEAPLRDGSRTPPCHRAVPEGGREQGEGNL